MRNIVVVDCGFFRELLLVLWIDATVRRTKSTNSSSRVVDLVHLELAIGAGGFRVSEEFG